MNQEDEIQAAIAAEKQRLTKLIADAAKRITSLDDRISGAYDERKTAIKDLEAKLEAAKKPYDNAIEAFTKERDAASHERYEMERKMNTTEYSIRALFSMKLPEFPDADSFKGYLLSLDIHTHTIDMVKKKLPNGVTLFRHYESHTMARIEKNTSSEASRVSYYAVKGKNIVGYIFTRKAQHPGDYAEVYCWMNSRLLRTSNQLSKNEYCAAPSVGFKKWKEMVSQLTSFTPIDLKNEKNRRILASDYNIDSDDMKD